MVIASNARSARSYAANEQLGVALIGVGGRGRWFAERVPQMERVVALCDVDDLRAAPGLRHLPEGTPYYHDFRVMLDERCEEIDAVIISTPDHTHAVASAAAMRQGKHVFCEKPLTNTVRESRILRDLARTTGVATQMGNQGTASGPFREAVGIIRGGHLGAIREVHVWNNGGGANRREPPAGDYDVPEHLHWDLWLGPAAFRPYHPLWMQRNLWRDFGTGQLGNWATHSANLAFMALEVDALWQDPPGDAEPEPIRVEAEVEAVNRLSFPQWEVVRWHVPARPGWPPITVTWHNGHAPGSRDLLEERMGEGLDWGDKGEMKWRDWAGTLIVGAEGSLNANEHNTRYRLLPEDRFRDSAPPPSELPRSPGHEREWFEACRGGPPAFSNFDYSGPLTEMLMLGNVATQFPGTLDFDPQACRITNHAEADAALHRAYRGGWEL